MRPGKGRLSHKVGPDQAHAGTGDRLPAKRDGNQHGVSELTRHLSLPCGVETLFYWRLSDPAQRGPRHVLPPPAGILQHYASLLFPTTFFPYNMLSFKLESLAPIRLVNADPVLP